MRWNVKCIVKNKHSLNVRYYYCMHFPLKGIIPEWEKQDLWSLVELI